MRTQKKLMEFAMAVIAILLMAGCNDIIEPPLHSDRDTSRSDAKFGQTIPGEYIVVFKPGVLDVPGLASQLAARHNGEISFVYQHAIKGFAATLSPEAVEDLRRHPQIAWIEADQLAWPAGPEMSRTHSGVFEKSGSLTGDDVPWNLDRIDQRGPILNNKYNYDKTGSGVTVYIIGEGISPHDEFEDRLREGWAPRGGSTLDQSNNGWSTGLAAVVGGKTYGVAKEVTLVPVRAIVAPVARNILAGLDWIIKDYEKNKGQGPAIVLATFFSRHSNALEETILSVINAGITFVAMGLNDETLDACSLTPSGTAGVITVGSTNQNDEITSSPLVDCIDIFAPGVGILSATNRNYYDTHTFNTHASMAAAHVAGVAALYLEANTGAGPGDVFRDLMESATKDLIKPSPNNNHLLYSRGWVPLIPSFTYSCDNLICTFSDTSEGDTRAWSWSFGDGNSASGVNLTNTYAEAGTYTVTLTVTDNEGATGTASQDVTVIAEDDGGEEPPPPSNEPPAASFTVSSNWLTCDFTDTSTDSDGHIAAWSWSFGDGATSGTQHPTHTYAEAGTYTVTLTVTDNDGATDTTSQDVTVIAEDIVDNTPPSITTFDVIKSTAGPWHRAQIDWAVNDQDGDLETVKLELLSGDTVLESKTISVSGSSASGSDELRSRINPDAVKIIVTDSMGNSNNQSVSY